MSRTMLVGNIRLDDNRYFSGSSRCRDNTGLGDYRDHLMYNLHEDIRPDDTLIFVGNVSRSMTYLQLIKSINCAMKILIVGDQDMFNLEIYRRIFDRVVSSYTENNFYVTSKPVIPMSIPAGCRNLYSDGPHYNKMRLGIQYQCISTERTDYTAVDINTI